MQFEHFCQDALLNVGHLRPPSVIIYLSGAVKSNIFWRQNFPLKSLYTAVVLLTLLSCTPSQEDQQAFQTLKLEHDKQNGTISLLRTNEERAILVQHAKAGTRPYIHPIVAPDGKGEVTEFSPPHHKHQTGLYWGLKELNGRDYFMNWKADYWQYRSSEVLDALGSTVRWKTVYALLGEDGQPVMEETQTWSFTEDGSRYILDLVWEGKAIKDVTMRKFYVGGLFVRMPWEEGVEGEAVNSVGQRNAEAEGQRAVWNDLGIVVPGRTDMAHITILDHPDNRGFPIPWRVDSQLGVGPSRQILGDWSIGQGEKEVIRYRILIYTGARDEQLIHRVWKGYVCE